MQPTKIWHPEKSVILCKVERLGYGGIIHAPVWIGERVDIGNACKIQAFAFIPDCITLEERVFIGPHVTFTNDPHLEIKGDRYWQGTLVKRGAKIGAGATIRAGITIGKESVVGMGSVVLCSIPDGEEWAGNPAKKL